MSEIDLRAGGFGGLLQQKRVYSNQLSGLPNPVNGFNWIVESWPYLVELQGGAIAFVKGTKASLWFDSAGSGAYIARFGAKSKLTWDAGAKLFTLWQPNGEEWKFHDFTQTEFPQGVLASYSDAGGQVVEVTDYTTNGQIEALSRSTSTGGDVTEQFQYTYNASSQLTSVTLQRKTGVGPFVPLLKTNYEYYGPSEAFGSIGDLKLVNRTEWKSATWSSLGTSYYRYWLVGQDDGFVHGLRYVVNEASYARLLTDGHTPNVAPNSVIAQYADNYFEYDGSHRVKKEAVFGGSAIYTYQYTPSSHPQGYNNWAMKTVETQPDASQVTVYTNYIGEVLVKQLSSGSSKWIEYYQFDSDGREILKAEPSAVVSFNEASANLSVSLKSNSGLIHLTEYYTSSSGGGAPGFRKATKLKQGSSGAPITQQSWQYVGRVAFGQTTYFVSKETTYPNDNGTGALETLHTYTWFDNTTQIQQQTTTLPAVPGAQNGTNVPGVRKSYFDNFGNLIWTTDERGFITRTKYNIATGAVTQRIEDVNTSTEPGVPSGWVTPTGGGLNLVTDYQHDDRGRITQTLGPTHPADVAGTMVNVRTARWTVYAENASQNIVRTAQGFATGSGPSYTFTLVNPVSIDIRAKNGKPLESIQATRVSTSGALLPSDSFSQSSYTRWSTYHYSDCCNLASERVYHLIPASGAGLSGTNYNQSSFGYDAMKRRNRTVSPGGTITRIVYDVRGLSISTWIGTNDNGASASDPAGGGAPGNNMLILTASQYDGGAAGGDGNLTRSTQYVSDTVTRVTNYLYDFRNRQTAIDGEVDFYQVSIYDNLNRVVQVDRRNTTSSGTLLARNETKYDNRGRVYQTVVHGVNPSTGALSGSQVFNFTYDQASNLIRQTPAGSMDFRESDYDSLGRRVEERIPLGIKTLYTFDAAGNLTVTTDPMNQAWAQRYDGIGRLVRSSNPLNQATTFGFNAAGYQTTVSNPLSETTTTNYDAAGRVVSVSDPLNKVTSFAYDPNGNQISVTDPNSLTTQSQYNYRNWLIKTIDPAGHENEFAYNRVGEMIQQTDAKGHDTTFAFDALGRRISTTDRLDYTTTFAWNALGLQASLTDAQSQITSYEYDVFQRLYRTTWPDHTPGSTPGNQNYGITQTEYDSLNRVLRTTDQLGDTITHSYDAAGRLLTKAYRTRVNSPSGTISDSDTFTYNANSQMLTAVCGRYTNTVTLTYDVANRKATEALTIAGRTYTSTTQYDAASRVSKLIYPNSSEVSRAYTARGELHTIKLGTTTIDTRSYDNGGRLTGSSYNNGISESRTYNADNTVATIQYSNPAIGNFSYTWDANHNKTSETISGVMSGYGFTASYDNDDRLIDWERADTNLDQSWNLSAVGNWNTFTQNATTQSRTHSPANEILTAASQNVQHDPKGNATLYPSSLWPSGTNLAMKWDFNNKLRAADTNNDATDDVFYLWDALGRRVGRTASGVTTIFVQNDQQTVADYPSGALPSSPTYTYLWGSYIDEIVLRTASAGNLYFHRNQQYSVTAVTTSAGAVAERYAYTAYGQPTTLNASASPIASSAINNRYTYTGREWDSTLCLYHFRARWMSGLAGRFLARDPIGYVDGKNLYSSYFAVSKLDPDGTQTATLPIRLAGVWGTALAEPSPLGEVAAIGITAAEVGAAVGVAIGVAELTRRCFCTYRYPGYQKCKWLDQTIDPTSALASSMVKVAGWAGPHVQTIRNLGAAKQCPGGSPGVRYAAEVVYYYQDTVSGKFVTYTIDFPVNCCACCNIFTVGVSCRQLHPGKGSGGQALPPAR